MRVRSQRFASLGASHEKTMCRQKDEHMAVSVNTLNLPDSKAQALSLVSSLLWICQRVMVGGDALFPVSRDTHALR